MPPTGLLIAPYLCEMCDTTETGAALGALTHVRGGVNHREINRENRYILQRSLVCSLRKI